MKTVERRILILVLALGLAAMLGAVVHQRLTEPSIVKRVQPRPQAAAQAMPQAETPVGRLMREMGERPDDPQVLLALALELIRSGSADQAGVFLDRAEALDAADPDVPYYRGYLLHLRGDHAGAVPLMERSLALKDRADVRFSLGALLAHFLGDPSAARAQFEAGLAAPDCTPERRELLESELARLPASSGGSGAAAPASPAPGPDAAPAAPAP